MSTATYSSSDIIMQSPSSSSSTSSASSSSSSLFSSVSSSSSTSSRSSIHPSSLVDASSHSPLTLRLVGITITQQLIDYVVDQVIETVDEAMGRPSTLLPASSSSKPHSRPTRSRTPVQQKFSNFATTVLTRAEITTPTLLVAMVYISRARPVLHIALEEWALERVFLGALIVASKYSNDSTLKNVHWALCTGVFGKRDVGRIEREFLAVLDWNLGVAEEEVLELWGGLEWFADQKEREEREKQAAKLEKEKKEKLRQLELLERQRQQQQQQQKSKFFVYSGNSSSTSASSSTSSVEAPLPPLPVRPRNHRRSAAPAPINVTSTTQSTTHSLSLPNLPTTRTHGHSPSSSSGSSSPESPSPATPEDLQLHYVYIKDGGEADDERSPRRSRSGEEVSAQQQPAQKKRGFGATTLELIKSFPIHLHHHHSSSHSTQQQQQQKRHEPYAYTLPIYHGRYATEPSQRPVKRLPLRTVS